MDFRIADTFTESLARLTGDEQKAAKTTAFDLQINPANPGLSFHKVDRSKDKNFWSVRVSADIRLIVHTRKENTAFKAPLSPDIMRGAGAVHGVADLVMLARQSYNKGELEIHVSSRNSNIPNFWLRRTKDTLVHVWQQPKTREKVNGLSRKMVIFRDVLLNELKRAGKGGLKIDQVRLSKALELAGRKEGVNKVDAGPDTLKKRINQLWKLGIIEARLTDSEGRRKNAAFNLEHWRLFPVTGKPPKKKNKKGH